ncbi:MAG TPA: carbohydrate kinase [Porphyromonadaceae bacterium]|nr:carbohydrate kinase [Porphyromonadaceae bacterium]
MRKIIGIGETILDITIKGNKPLSCNAGGSVFNTLSALGRVGLNPIYITEMGKDRVGDMLLGAMRENGIDTRFIYHFEEGNSPISLAFLDDKNNASYQFFLKYPEKRLQVEFPDFNENDILVIASYYCISPDVRGRIKELIEKAKRGKALIFYDINFRRGHLGMLEKVRPFIEENMASADIVRGSDEDFKLIYSQEDFRTLYREHLSSLCPYVFCTRGENGVELSTPSLERHFEAKKIIPISTIGAGDNFNAGILYSILKQNIGREQLHILEEESWKAMVQKGIDFSTSACMNLENYISKEFAQRERI